MLIVCPSCATAYQIELSTLGAAGRTVRCARCQTKWFATVASAVPTAPGLIAAQPASTGSAALQAVASNVPPPRDPAPAGGEVEDADTPDRAAQPHASEDEDQPADPMPDPVGLMDSPSLVPVMEHDPTPLPDDRKSLGPISDDIETIAARRARAMRSPRRRSLPKLRMPGLPATILILLAVIAALINWRTYVVRALPQTASLFAATGLPVNLRGLSFEDVRSLEEFHEGMAVLMVEGTIVNVTSQPVEVPRLRFAVRSAAGHEVYAWTALPTASILTPGDRLPFQTRLASPPADGREIIVRFFNRHDMIGGVN